jgi:NAD(P)-dependent dehydrogenase (short-subunit alcohol dehydrogenase family)
MPVYSQSKPACLMFAFELQRRSEAGGCGIASIAAHPGVSRTDLLHNAPGRWSVAGVARTFLWSFSSQSRRARSPRSLPPSPRKQKPALITVRTDWVRRGYPALSKIPQREMDAAAASRLWDVSEELTGLRFEQRCHRPTKRRARVLLYPMIPTSALLEH